MISFPKISDVKQEGTYRASKWTQLRVLFDASEMRKLIEELSPFHILNVSKPVTREEALISPETFFDAYQTYTHSLETDAKALFSSAWTSTLEELYAMPIDEERFLIKVRRPVIQLRAARFTYFSLNQKITPMALGPNSISWGIEFSYPHLFQSPDTQEIDKSAACLNTPLFRTLQRFVRQHSTPTTFQIDGKTFVSPIRLGKVAKKWIDRHPHLRREQIRVI